jgi:hypothetical protein
VARDLGLPDRSFDVVTSTLAAHHIPEAARPAAFGEMYRVLRPGGTLLVADLRPPGRRRTLHSFGSAARHGTAVPLDVLATAAGFRIEARGDLRLLRYIRAVRPDTTAAVHVQKEKAMLTAEAHVQTSQPGRYLAQLSRHAQQVHRMRHRPHSPNEGDAQPPPKVEHAEWSETRGSIDFGWGRCTLEANGDLLTLRAEAAEEEDLQRVQDIITRDIERFSSREHLEVSWQLADPPISPADRSG